MPARRRGISERSYNWMYSAKDTRLLGDKYPGVSRTSNGTKIFVANVDHSPPNGLFTNLDLLGQLAEARRALFGGFGHILLSRPLQRSSLQSISIISNICHWFGGAGRGAGAGRRCLVVVFGVFCGGVFSFFSSFVTRRHTGGFAVTARHGTQRKDGCWISVSGRPNVVLCTAAACGVDFCKIFRWFFSILRRV